ncbi:MAG: YraN family protein [Dethiobacter sp.]|jgi:putative endonuclease|nr:YraN family protein [Dethiobacter sp.]
MSRRRIEVGAAGEEAARAYLENNGCVIETVNYRCIFGEIDIVARDGSMLVFVEVRAGTGSSLQTAAESVTRPKLIRLRKLVLYYLKAVYGRDLPCRVDLLTVLLEKESLKVRQVQHIRNIVPG